MMTKNKLTKIMLLSLPIIGGMVSQNLLNLIDTAMVGQLGAVALAAVGIGSFAVFMSQSLVLGLSSSVQAVVSRRVGEGLIKKARNALTSGIIIAILMGSVLTALIYPFVGLFFSYLNADCDVNELGVSYWRIRLLGMVFMGINYSFRGYLNGISQPKYYLFSLIFMHILNVFLNYILIYGHLGFSALGTDGAAIASTIATVVGSLFYLGLSQFKLRSYQLFSKLPSLQDMRNVFKLTIPAGLQQFMIALSLTSLFWMIGQLGVQEVAVLNILINILMLCLLPGFGFGMASATLVGKSLGEKNQTAAKQWAYDVAKVAGLMTFIMGLLISIFSKPLLMIFTNDSELILLAQLPLQITGLLIALDVMSVVLMNSLLGSGDVKVVLKTSLIFQWLFFFPVAAFLVLTFNPPLLLIWMLFITSRFLQGLVYITVWYRNKWGQIKI